MDIYYDPLDCKCKDITGGIKQNEKLILNIFGNASSCFLVLQKDGEAAEYKHMQRRAGKSPCAFRILGCIFIILK